MGGRANATVLLTPPPYSLSILHIFSFYTASFCRCRETDTFVCTSILYLPIHIQDRTRDTIILYSDMSGKKIILDLNMEREQSRINAKRMRYKGRGRCEIQMRMRWCSV